MSVLYQQSPRAAASSSSSASGTGPDQKHFASTTGPATHKRDKPDTASYQVSSQGSGMAEAPDKKFASAKRYVIPQMRAPPQTGAEAEPVVAAAAPAPVYQDTREHVLVPPDRQATATATVPVEPESKHSSEDDEWTPEPGEIVGEDVMGGAVCSAPMVQTPRSTASARVLRLRENKTKQFSEENLHDINVLCGHYGSLHDREVERYYGLRCFRFGAVHAVTIVNRLKYGKPLVDSIVEIYQRNQGRCLLTGVALDLSGVDKRAGSRTAGSMIRLVGDEHSPGNVIPVARCVSKISGRVDVPMLIAIAHEMRRFVEFCEQHKERDRFAILRMWNVRETRAAIGARLGIDLIQPDESALLTSLERRHKTCALFDSEKGFRTKISCDAMHSLYMKQEGRCWYTGLPLCDGQYEHPAFRLSVDRIDNSRLHTPDNIRMTTGWFNIARGDCSPDIVVTTLLDITKYTPDFQSVLDKTRQKQ